MSVKRWLIVLLATLLATVWSVGCSSDSTDQKLPDAAGLLRDAAGVTSKINTAHFTLKVDGTPPKDLKIRDVDGFVNRNGEAKGSLKIDVSGILIQGDFVIVGGTAFFKGPTGQFQKYTAERTRSLYDTTVILDPARGIAHLLSSTTDAKSEAKEKVDGVETYRVSGKATKSVVNPIVPGIDTDTVNVEYWIRADGDKQMVRALITLPSTGATVEAKLLDPNKPFDVAPPA